MNTAWVGVIAALGGAAIGASVTIVQMVLGHFRDRDKRLDSLLVTALTFLAGNETERSCGVSMIEGVFAERKSYANVLVPALTSQAVQLLLHTTASESRTEFYNWLRIMELLEHFFSEFKIIGNYYGEIGNAFLVKVSPDHTGGLNIPLETLKPWAARYSMDLDAEASAYATA